MLQQTQVKTVLERYYRPFLQLFPNLATLAYAPTDVLMKAWEGLGYYSRAANVQRAALACVKEHKGQLPDDFERLLALPGIGINTAHAILAFAHRKPVAVMEANVKRVLCRMFALPSPTDAQLWSLAGIVLDTRNPFDHNQAMMDIGATVCTKRAPNCPICPLASACEGKHAPHAYPAAKVKKASPVRERVIVAWRDADGAYHVTQRKGKFLHGLYGFDEYESTGGALFTHAQLHPLGHVSQTYSHFRLEADVFCGIMEEGFRWNDGSTIPLENIHLLPLSRADAKVLRLLEDYDALGSAKAARKKK